MQQLGISFNTRKSCRMYIEALVLKIAVIICPRHIRLTFHSFYGSRQINKHMCAIAIQVRCTRSEREQGDKNIGEITTALALKIVYDSDNGALSISLHAAVIRFEVVSGVC